MMVKALLEHRQNILIPSAGVMGSGEPTIVAPKWSWIEMHTTAGAMAVQAEMDELLVKEIRSRGVAVTDVRFFIDSVDERHVSAVLETIMAENLFIEDCDHRQNGMLLESLHDEDGTYSLRFIKPSSPQTAEEDLRRARELFIPTLARFSGDYDGSEFATAAANGGEARPAQTAST